MLDAVDTTGILATVATVGLLLASAFSRSEVFSPT